MWLIKASLKNPYMVATLVFMILVLGFVAMDRIAIDILPVFKAPAVQVLTYFQGMPASSIEKTITNRVERWVNQAPGAAVVEGFLTTPEYQTVNSGAAAMAPARSRASRARGA